MTSDESVVVQRALDIQALLLDGLGRTAEARSVRERVPFDFEESTSATPETRLQKSEEPQSSAMPLSLEIFPEVKQSIYKSRRVFDFEPRKSFGFAKPSITIRIVDTTGVREAKLPLGQTENVVIETGSDAEAAFRIQGFGGDIETTFGKTANR